MIDHVPRAACVNDDHINAVTYFNVSAAVETRFLGNPGLDDGLYVARNGVWLGQFPTTKEPFLCCIPSGRIKVREALQAFRSAVAGNSTVARSSIRMTIR